MRTVVIGHTAFTLAMFGLMWAVQIIIYPQFRTVGAADFASYIADHSTRITVALALLAPAEVVFSAWLWLDTPTGLNHTVVFVSGALLAAGWIATALWFGPLHGKLGAGFNLDRINLLITTNWFRTALWSARAVLAAMFAYQLIDTSTS